MTRAGCLLLALLVLAPLGTALAASLDEDDPRVRHLDGNEALAAMAKRQGWKGIGSPSQPFRMQVADVVLDEVSPLPYLRLANVSAHVRIEGLSVSSISRANLGIHLYRVSNVTIVGADLDHLQTGILVEQSNDVDIVDSRVRHSMTGVKILRSTDVEVRGVRADINDRAFALEGQASLGNRFRDNVVANAEGQLAFHFADPTTRQFPWDNVIENTTTVNGEPMRWFRGLRGTQDSPLVLRDVHVREPGLTNVAQVVCYRCIHVTLENATIVGGSQDAAGFVAIDGMYVRLREPRIEEARVAVEFRHGHRNAVSGGSLVAVTEGIRLVMSNGTTIEDTTIRRDSGTSRPGITIEASNNVTATRVEILNQNTGVLATHAPFLRLHDVNVTSADEGIRLSSAPDAILERIRVAGSKVTGVALSASPDSLLRDVTVDASGATGMLLAQSGDSLLDRVDVARASNGLVLERSGGARVVDARIHDNRLFGVVLRDQAGAELASSRIEGNAGGGIHLQQAGASRLHDLTLADNGATGIRLESARPSSTLERIDLSNHTRAIELTRSADTRFRENRITLVGAQTGFHFADDESYDVDLDTSNLVDGKPMRWITRPVGAPGSPLVLSGLEAAGGRFSNVGQIVIYRGSHVVVDAAHATGGAAGLFVYGSSNVSVFGGDFSRNDVGVLLTKSRASSLRDADVSESGVGVRLQDTATSVITGIDAHGTGVAVELRGDSRQNEVDLVDASNATRSVEELTTITGYPKPHNFVVDAGLDLLVSPNTTVELSSGLRQVPFDHERISHHHWDFGDNETAESTEAEFTPSHAYLHEGNYTATYTARTESGRTFTDTARVLVWRAPDAPRNLTVNGTGGIVRLSWSVVSGSGATYEVLRASHDGDFVRIALVQDATGYIDATAVPNETYRYEVRAVRGPLASETAASKPTRVQSGPLAALLAQAGIDADGFSAALANLSASPNDPDAAAALLDAAGVRDGAKQAEEVIEATVTESAAPGAESDGTLESQGAMAWILQPNKRMQLLLVVGGIALIVLLLAQSTRR